MKRLNSLIASWVKKPENTLIELNAQYLDDFHGHLEELSASLPASVSQYRAYTSTFSARNPFFPFNEIITGILNRSEAKYDLAPFVFFMAQADLGKYVARSTRKDYESFHGAHKRILYLNGIIKLFKSLPGRHVFMVERFDQLSETAQDIFENLLKHSQGNICLVTTGKKAVPFAKAALYKHITIKSKGRSGLARLKKAARGLAESEKRIVDMLSVLRCAGREVFRYFNQHSREPLKAGAIDRGLKHLIDQRIIVKINDKYRLISDEFTINRYNAMTTAKRLRLHLRAGEYYEKHEPHRQHLQAMHFLFSETNKKAFSLFINLGRQAEINGTGIDVLRELKLAVSVLGSLREPGRTVRRERVELYYLICLLSFRVGKNESGREYLAVLEQVSAEEDDYLRAELLGIQISLLGLSTAVRLELAAERLALLKRRRVDAAEIVSAYCSLIHLCGQRAEVEAADAWIQQALAYTRTQSRRKYQILVLSEQLGIHAGTEKTDAVDKRLSRIPEPVETSLKVEFHLAKSLIAYRRRDFDAMVRHQDITLHEILRMGNYAKLQSMLTRYTGMNISSRYYAHVHNQVESLINESALFLEEFSTMGMMSQLAREINRGTGEQRRTAEIVEREVAFLKNFDKPGAIARAYEVLGDIYGEGPQNTAEYRKAQTWYRRAFKIRSQEMSQWHKWDYLNLIDATIKLKQVKESRRLFDEFVGRFGRKDRRTETDVLRVAAMLHAIEGNLKQAKKTFEKIVAPERREMAQEDASGMINSIGRGMFEYGQFLYEHQGDPAVAEPVSRILEIFSVTHEIFAKEGDFFVYLKGSRDMLDRINRESYFEVEMEAKQAALMKLMQSLSAINAIQDMSKLLPRITDLALETVKGEGAVMVIDTDGVLYPLVIRGFDEKDITMDSLPMRAARQVFENEKTLLTTSRDIYDELKLEAKSFVLDLRSVMVMPIQSGRQCYGVIYLDCNYFSNVFNQDSVDLLAAFANQAAIAIENVRLFESATRDGLTGLYGHVAFREIARQEFIMSQRYDHNFTVCILDVDNFKTINDTYGHAAGNAALQEFAELLRKSLRGSDIISRYGGDEFEIILPRTSKKAARVLLEKLRKKIESYAFLKGEGDVKTSSSIGLASFPEDDRELEDLFRRADRNLYKAKREGKNRVCF